MEALPLPKSVQFIKEEGNESVVVIEPCYPGYGVTLGNALRRVLLSSLPGAAATAVKIKGVDHEFSTIPGVKEDVVDILLNIKQICVKSFSEEPVKIKLKSKGAKVVTAGMIEKNSDIEVKNPDLKIATLDGKNSELEMELTVQQGRGYSTVEMRETEKQEIGIIALDALFTPVRNVYFSVENVRVGKITDYDKITVTIVTNGVLTGREALSQATQVLVDHFKLVHDEVVQVEEQKTPEALEESQLVPESTATPEASYEAGNVETSDQEDLLSLSLSRRSYNALIKNGVNSVGQLKTLNREKLETFTGLGEKSITEILEVISTLK